MVDIHQIASFTEEELLELQRIDPAGFARLARDVKQKHIEAARTDINAFIPYVMKDEGTGLPVVQSKLHYEMQDFVEKNRYCVIWGAIESAKCSTSNTILVTCDGRFTTVGELYASQQEKPNQKQLQRLPRLLTLVPGVKGLSDYQVVPDQVERVWLDAVVPCKKIRAANGCVLEVSHLHPLWVRRAAGNKKSKWVWVNAMHIKPGDFVMAPTALPFRQRLNSKPATSAQKQKAFELGALWTLATDSGQFKRRPGHGELVSLRSSSRYPQGAQHDIQRIVRHVAKAWGETPEFFDETGANGSSVVWRGVACRGLLTLLMRHGLAVTYSSPPRRNVKRLRTYYAKPQLPVFGVPEMVLDGDRETIVNFLAGLCIGAIEYSFSTGHKLRLREEVARGVLLLLSRLGIVASVAPPHKGFVTLKIRAQAFSQVIDCLTSYSPRYAAFSAKYEDDVRHPVYATRVIEVTDTPPQPVYGIEMASYHTHLTSGIYTHNTQQISIARTLFWLGNNRNLKILILQAKMDGAIKTLAAIKQYIEHSEELHEVFPELRPGGEWRANAIRVERDIIVRTPSVLVAGVGSQTILGDRYDKCVMDDVNNYENTRTQYRRDETMNWIVSTPMSRMVAEGQIVVIGNKWGDDTCMERFGGGGIHKGMPGWRSKVFPLITPEGELTWPERWPLERILEWEGTRTKAEADRALRCIAHSDETSLFKLDWFEAALVKGHGLYGQSEMAWSIPEAVIEQTGRYKDSYIVTGVDIGVTQADTSSYTALVHLCFLADGDVELLCVERGRFTTQGMLEKLLDAHDRYGQQVMFVESVAAQAFILGFLRMLRPGIRVEPFNTRGSGNVMTNKHHHTLGMRSVAVELERGYWALPRAEDGRIANEVRELIEGLRKYTPQGKAADTAMAAWIALQGGRSFFVGEQGEQRTFGQVRPGRLSQAEERAGAADELWSNLRAELDL